MMYLIAFLLFIIALPVLAYLTVALWPLIQLLFSIALLVGLLLFVVVWVNIAPDIIRGLLHPISTPWKAVLLSVPFLWLGFTAWRDRKNK
jgi:hypothetical protein